MMTFFKVVNGCFTVCWETCAVPRCQLKLTASEVAARFSQSIFSSRCIEGIIRLLALLACVMCDSLSLVQVVQSHIQIHLVCCLTVLRFRSHQFPEEGCTCLDHSVSSNFFEVQCEAG